MKMQMNFSYGLVGLKINIEEYGSIGLGPVISSSVSGLLSSSSRLLTLLEPLKKKKKR